mgnify:CR=1 FL=1|nr:MAG TPA: hypothetical protein [Caudoviricetes sp.]
MMADEKEIKRKLFDKLKAFYPDKDFVVGVISNVKYDDDRQAIIDYMENGEDVSVENIILLSLHLKNERNKKD